MGMLSVYLGVFDGDMKLKSLPFGVLAAVLSSRWILVS